MLPRQLRRQVRHQGGADLHAVRAPVARGGRGHVADHPQERGERRGVGEGPRLVGKQRGEQRADLCHRRDANLGHRIGGEVERERDERLDGRLAWEEGADVRELQRQRVPEPPVVSLCPHLDDGAEVLVARFGREGAQEGRDRRDHANLDFVEVLEKVVERRHQLRLGELAAEDGRQLVHRARQRAPDLPLHVGRQGAERLRQLRPT
mmetsp:Transcript_13427/g.45273  ORF Transcript_13427/g.45273 Transcript_13427/m.45273 type:complete len:207 (-) Transcript_13427:1154-1774(-)